MKHFSGNRYLRLPVFISMLVIPVFAMAANEGKVEVSAFSIGDSKSDRGIAEVGTSGTIIEAEYEAGPWIYSFGFEKWNYSWKNTASLPFAPGIVGNPWDSFTTIALGIAHEKRINKHWEYILFGEAKSAYEKESNGSYAYEAGVEFVYEPSKTWAYTFKLALEHEDLDGSGVGVDVDIEWNPDTHQGWSGEFVVGTEAPDITLAYHFSRDLISSIYFKEAGGSLVRLSDTSQVPGHKAGYVEDQYNAFGVQVDYAVVKKGFLSFSVQKNSGRTFTFTDKAGIAETEHDFGNSTELSVKYSHEF